MKPAETIETPPFQQLQVSFKSMVTCYVSVH